MHSKDLIREKLLRRKAELQDRLERAARDLRHAKAPLSPDFAEQATETANDDVLGALDDAFLTELRRIERALERLAAGTYGRCTGCGGVIEPQRLEAVPTATLCVKCAETG